MTPGEVGKQLGPKMTIKDILSYYDAIGGWWSYNSTKVPTAIKISAAGSEAEFDKLAKEVCLESYRANKPSSGDYCGLRTNISEDWG